jgi:hypothetical protein
MNEYTQDENGAYINPAELNRIADMSGFSVLPSVVHALRRAALEISRERGRIDSLQAVIDAT